MKAPPRSGRRSPHSPWSPSQSGSKGPAAGLPLSTPGPSCPSRQNSGQAHLPLPLKLPETAKVTVTLRFGWRLTELELALRPDLLRTSGHSFFPPSHYVQKQPVNSPQINRGTEHKYVHYTTHSHGMSPTHLQPKLSLTEILGLLQAFSRKERYEKSNLSN